LNAFSLFLKEIFNEGWEKWTYTFTIGYVRNHLNPAGRERVRLEMKNKITKEVLCPPPNSGYTPLKRRIAAKRCA
jgi:hypothetical protein